MDKTAGFVILEQKLYACGYSNETVRQDCETTVCLSKTERYFMHWTALFSHLFGIFASKEFPPFIRKIINNLYVKLMRVDMSEFNDPDSYPTLNALFSRELKYKRTIDTDDEILISPVDALVTECGTIKDNILLQIKGMPYSVDDLLTDRYVSCAQKIYGGSFINFYLSPKDYHRYHAPCKLRIVSLLYKPGKLYPVNISSCRKRLNLFIQNERVIIECYDIAGRLFFIVLVGALDVGKIILSFDSRVHKNVNCGKPSYYKYENLWLDKAEQIGMFMMGSTVVLIGQPDTFNIEVGQGEKIRFGEPVARLIRSF